jgi:hypothetical protein
MNAPNFQTSVILGKQQIFQPMNWGLIFYISSHKVLGILAYCMWK